MKKVLRLTSIFALLFCLVALCSCAPKSLEKAKAKLEKKDYVVLVDANLSSALIEDAVGSITATKTNDDDETIGLSAILFESQKAAKEYFEDHKPDEVEEGQVYKRLGKWVVSGSKEAYKAFR